MCVLGHGFVDEEVEELEDARDSLFPPRRPRPVPSSRLREEVLVAAAVEDEAECFILKHNQVIMCNFVWRAGICIFTLPGRAFGLGVDE